MDRLSRLVKQGAVGEEPLPPAFPSWTERGMRIRRASVHLWSGPSGSFKTTVILNAILNMGVTTVVYSTDSDEATVASRILGILTHTPTAHTEEWLRPNSPHLERAAKTLAGVDFLRWDFAASPSLDDVWLGLYAYATMEGCWPDQVVIDIASDIGHDTGDEWGSLRDLLRQSKVIARETRAAVHLVHHTTDNFTPSLEHPVPSKREVMGKVSAIPVLMVNFGPGSDGEIPAACVKNRHAKADPLARDWFRMKVDPSTAYVTDWVPLPDHQPVGGIGEETDWWPRQAT